MTNDILAKRIADLERQLSTAKSERDEKAAQVEYLKSHFNELIEIAQRCDSWESFPQKPLDRALAALQSLPQQCLLDVHIERDALAAQVEVQNDVIKYAHNKLYILSHNRNDVSARCIGDADKAFKVVDDYLLANKTPQQCLAEIKAQVANDVAIYICDSAFKEGVAYKSDIIACASEYAATVRQGGAE